MAGIRDAQKVWAITKVGTVLKVDLKCMKFLWNLCKNFWWIAHKISSSHSSFHPQILELLYQLDCCLIVPHRIQQVIHLGWFGYCGSGKEKFLLMKPEIRNLNFGQSSGGMQICKYISLTSQATAMEKWWNRRGTSNRLFCSLVPRWSWSFRDVAWNLALASYTILVFVVTRSELHTGKWGRYQTSCGSLSFSLTIRT